MATLTEAAGRLVEQVASEDGSSPLDYAVHMWTLEHLENRREIRSFFVQEVDRDKVVLYSAP